jgi:hypothetical protein
MPNMGIIHNPPGTRKPPQQIDPGAGIQDIPAADQNLANQGIVQAFLNCGRWIIMCPDDPQGLHAGQVDPDTDTIFICAGCYPDIIAKAFTPGDDGFFRPVDDPVKQQAAADQAAADGNAYTIQFPDDPAVSDIMAAVQYRPTANMNWVPGETLDDLNQENLDHNISAQQPQTTVSGGD